MLHEIAPEDADCLRSRLDKVMTSGTFNIEDHFARGVYFFHFVNRWKISGASGR